MTHRVKTNTVEDYQLEGWLALSGFHVIVPLRRRPRGFMSILTQETITKYNDLLTACTTSDFFPDNYWKFSPRFKNLFTALEIVSSPNPMERVEEWASLILKENSFNSIWIYGSHYSFIKGDKQVEFLLAHYTSISKKLVQDANCPVRNLFEKNEVGKKELSRVYSELLNLFPNHIKHGA